MKLIYDIVLNFNDTNNNYEFYEWKKDDSFTYIEKIPIIKVSSKQMDELINHTFIVPKSFLNRIVNKTISINTIISYSVLLTDSIRVIAFLFDKTGLIKKKSNLLIDEEEDILMDTINLEKESLSYKLIDKIDNNTFLTRKEKEIQKYLLREINKSYLKKDYEMIHYLYCELSNKKRNREEEYQYIINCINANYQDTYQNLFEIINLTQNEKRTNC